MYRLKKIERALVAPFAGASVHMRDGTAFVTGGPFAETKEILGASWIVEAAGREETIDIPHRRPHAEYGTVEVHPCVMPLWRRRLRREHAVPVGVRRRARLDRPDGAKSARFRDPAARQEADRDRAARRRRRTSKLTFSTAGKRPWARDSALEPPACQQACLQLPPGIAPQRHH
jgi:hypothetical protein